MEFGYQRTWYQTISYWISNTQHCKDTNCIADEKTPSRKRTRQITLGQACFYRCLVHLFLEAGQRSLEMLIKILCVKPNRTKPHHTTSNPTSRICYKEWGLCPKSIFWSWNLCVHKFSPPWLRMCRSALHTPALAGDRDKEEKIRQVRRWLCSKTKPIQHLFLQNCFEIIITTPQ